MTSRWLLKGILKRPNAVRDERGATAVEFALVAPIFLMFVIGMFDLGRLFFIKNTMQYTVEQTARYAMVNPTLTETELETYATTEGDKMFTGITFTAEATVVGTVNYRNITASYSFDFLMPLVNLTGIPLVAKSRTPVNPTP